jgi:hypothetical protein
MAGGNLIRYMERIQEGGPMRQLFIQSVHRKASSGHTLLRRTSAWVFAALIILLAVTTTAWAQNKPASPEEFFGFRLGSDRNIARWDKIVEYFSRLEKEASTIKVVNIGPSTLGNPFLLVIISSAENLARLDRLQVINARLSDPRGIPEAEIRNLVREGKAVICQSMSLHATSSRGPTRRRAGSSTTSSSSSSPASIRTARSWSPTGT